MVLYVTRHGETDYNVEMRYAGSTDLPLNETGILQAEELVRRVSGLSLDAVICSPLIRARKTAEIVSSALDIPYSVHENFTERKMGVFEGLKIDEARELYPELWHKIRAGDPDAAVPGGETLRQVCNRVDFEMERLLKKYSKKTILLICHVFVTQAVHRYCHSLPIEEMSDFILKNCEVIKIWKGCRNAKNDFCCG